MYTEGIRVYDGPGESRWENSSTAPCAGGHRNDTQR